MKKLVSFLLFVLLSVTVFSQIPNFGIKAGFNSSKLTSDINEYNEESILGYNAGVFLRLNLGKAYIQPEAYFTRKGGKLKFNPTIDPGVGTIDNKIKLNTLDIPILLGYKIIDLKIAKLRINAGPVASFILNKEVDVKIGEGQSSSEPLSKNDFKNAIWGIQAGAGIDISQFTIDVRYEWGINDISDIQSMESKSNLINISLGWKIL